MSWSDPCGRCEKHRADCDCEKGYVSVLPAEENEEEDIYDAVRHWRAKHPEQQIVYPETYPYLKSEMDRQIILLKSLGIKYPQSGTTFEQCINTVFMRAQPLNASAIIEAQQEYIQLLSDELTELAGMAAVHGWKSTRYQKGAELRDKISQLQK